MKIKTLLLGLLVLAFAMATPAPAENDSRIQVVTTLPDYAWLATLIGGDRVEVQHIVRGDQDAHFKIGRASCRERV